MQQQMTITECLLCKVPLGAESRDLDFRLCKEHRKCNICSEDMRPREIAAAQSECEESYEGSLDNLPALLQHPRCATLQRSNADQDPSVIVKQSYLDYLNNIRLLWEVETELSPETNEQSASIACGRLLINQPLEKIFLHLSRMQAAVAHISIALAKDRNKIKAVLDKREATKFAEAKKQAATSARPTTKVTDGEILLAEFMRQHSIKERTVGKQLWKKRSDAINHFIKSGIAELLATEMVDKMMVENGSLNKRIEG